MIGHIEGNDDPHSTPPGLDSEFVQKLFQDGKFTICVCGAIIVGTPYVQVYMTENYMTYGTSLPHNCI